MPGTSSLHPPSQGCQGGEGGDHSPEFRYSHTVYPRPVRSAHCCSSDRQETPGQRGNRWHHPIIPAGLPSRLPGWPSRQRSSPDSSTGCFKKNRPLTSHCFLSKLGHIRRPQPSYGRHNTEVRKYVLTGEGLRNGAVWSILGVRDILKKNLFKISNLHSGKAQSDQDNWSYRTYKDQALFSSFLKSYL